MWIETINKIVKFILFTSLIVWFGGNVVRNSIAFTLFEPGSEFILLYDFTDPYFLTTVKLFGVAGAYTATCYVVVFLMSIYLFISNRKYFKIKGWIFIAFILFLLSAIIEIPNTYLDTQLAIAIRDDVLKDKIQDLFMIRFENAFFATGSAISLFVNTSILALLVWRPLETPSVDQHGKII